MTARQPYQGVPGFTLCKIDLHGKLQLAPDQHHQADKSHGFQLLGSYVWSKNLDELNGEGGTDTFETQIPSNNERDLRRFSYGLGGMTATSERSLPSSGQRRNLDDVDYPAPYPDGLAVLRYWRDPIGGRAQHLRR